jgi:uncharacterized UPF0160 family protein
MWFKKVSIYTHNGAFHADDVFAVAALSLVFDGKIRVVRTRDEDLLAKARGIVVDVGGVYDPISNRFDHHQLGGAGARDNGIPYASFGLVWKTYGKKVCARVLGTRTKDDSHFSSLITIIDNVLVSPIDADDNGFEISQRLKSNKGEFYPRGYFMGSLVAGFVPTWKEETSGRANDRLLMRRFREAVSIAIRVLTNEIKKGAALLEAQRFVTHAYEIASDKRIIVLDGSYPWRDTLAKYSEPLYVVVPRIGTRVWHVTAVRNPSDPNPFKNKKDLPLAWAGLRDKDLAHVAGVPDAIFCHNKRFMAVARSKEGALALAQKALHL